MAKSEQLVKVWPLRPGVVGVSLNHAEVELQPGVPGFMTKPAAIAAVKRGDVQKMAGLSTTSIRKPTYETRKAAPRKRGGKGTYHRTDMTAESVDSSNTESVDSE